MKYLSICDGIGAAHVAWGPLGWSCVGASEIERFPIEVVKQRQPQIQELGDMTKYHEWNIQAPDLVCGGTPCQSFSVAGLRKGMADPRGNLALVFLGIVDHFRPRWVVWENVPGVVSATSHDAPDPCPPPPPMDLELDGQELETGDEYDSEEIHAFNSFLAGLSELGYGIAYRHFDAQYSGLAQRRKRVFVVGCFGDEHAAQAVLFERHSMQGHPAPSRGQGQGVAATVNASAPSRRNGGSDPTAGHFVAHTLKAEGFDGSEDGSGRGVPLIPEVAFTLCAHGGPHGRHDPTTETMLPLMVRMREGKDGGGKGPLVSEDQSLTLATSNDQVLAYNVQSANSCAMTGGGDAMAANPADVSRALDSAGFTANQGGTVALGPQMQVRRLTPRECERLQGFPDDYTSIDWSKRASVEKIAADVLKYYERTGYTGDRLVQAALCPDGPRYKALGNSWAVPVVRWIGERIAQVEAIISKAEAA